MSEEIALDAVGRRYPIQREIGRGGMSVVYEALDPRIGRRVAVKLLHPHLACRADARKRFLQEATAIARLEDALVSVQEASGIPAPPGSAPSLPAGPPGSSSASSSTPLMRQTTLSFEVRALQRAPPVADAHVPSSLP